MDEAASRAGVEEAGRVGRRATVLVAAMAVALLAAGGAAFAAVVSNGGFETGDLGGWTTADRRTSNPDFPTGSNGGWFAYEGTQSPLSEQPIAAPPVGTFAATTDQDGPGSHVLYKDVKLARGMKHTLSFYLYYDNSADGFSPRATLDPDVEPNQQYRVDVMKPSAGAFSVTRGDVLARVFRTEEGARNRLAPTRRTFNLTPFAGRTVRLRFAEVDNQEKLLASVDAVKVASKRR